MNKLCYNMWLEKAMDEGTNPQILVNGNFFAVLKVYSFFCIFLHCFAGI